MDFQLEDKQDAEIEKLKYYHEIPIRESLLPTGDEYQGYNLWPK